MTDQRLQEVEVDGWLLEMVACSGLLERGHVICSCEPCGSHTYIHTYTTKKLYITDDRYQLLETVEKFRLFSDGLPIVSFLFNF